MEGVCDIAVEYTTLSYCVDRSEETIFPLTMNMSEDLPSVFAA